MGRDSFCSTADSYIDLAVQGPGCVAEMAASREEAKYATLQTLYGFQPIVVETLGPIWTGLPSRTILDRTNSAERFSIFSLIFCFYFGSCFLSLLLLCPVLSVLSFIASCVIVFLV